MKKIIKQGSITQVMMKREDAIEYTKTDQIYKLELIDEIEEKN